MMDYFALLGQPRRPWIEEGPLKQRFLELSSECHPDRVHADTAQRREQAGQIYAELNAGYNCLRDPKERLLHLLELETGRKPSEVQRIPPGTMDLFVEVGQVCREVDGYLTKKKQMTSPLLKVQFFREGTQWVTNLMTLQGRINARREELLNEIKEMNSAFEHAAELKSFGTIRELSLERLEQAYRALSYAARWTGQIQDRLVQISE